MTFVKLFSFTVHVCMLYVLSVKFFLWKTWKFITCILLQPNDDTLIQVEGASTHIICNGEEIVRTKIRDTLLRCLQKLWTEHFHTSCNLSFFHISALWINPGFPSVSVCTLHWSNIFFKKWTKCFLYAEGIHVLSLLCC